MNKKQEIRANFWLLDGKEIVIKGDSINDFLMELDNFFDIFKEEVGYYLGSSDETIVKKLTENEINFEEV